MVLYPWNFSHVKKKHEKEYFSLKFSISFQVVTFIFDVFKTFVNTLCYNNDENCDILKLQIVVPLKM
jgi:hypothetical protein